MFTTTTERLPVSSIIVGDRRREDMGDIAGLADSIGEYGLLHPVVVTGTDEGYKLVAGHRRLEACRKLGMDQIEARDIGTLTDAELREIELEENLRRKDLTPYERSKTMVQRATVAAQVDREQSELRPDSGHNPSHRPEEPGSKRRVQQRAGIPRSTLHEAEKHVETADAYPFMQSPDWKQSHVLEARKALDSIPDQEREVAAERAADAPSPKEAIAILKDAAAEAEPETPVVVLDKPEPKAEPAEAPEADRDPSDFALVERFHTALYNFMGELRNRGREEVMDAWVAETVVMRIPGKVTRFAEMLDDLSELVRERQSQNPNAFKEVS